MNAEGWYQDPYGRHQERWFSDGAPTKLVRDSETVANDPPPAFAPPEPLVRPGPHAPARADDLLRADDAERAPEPAQSALTLSMEAVVSIIPELYDERPGP